MAHNCASKHTSLCYYVNFELLSAHHAEVARRKRDQKPVVSLVVTRAKSEGHHQHHLLLVRAACEMIRMLWHSQHVYSRGASDASDAV
jgi:hypothetical protein